MFLRDRAAAKRTAEFMPWWGKALLGQRTQSCHVCGMNTALEAPPKRILAAWAIQNRAVDKVVAQVSNLLFRSASSLRAP